MPNETTWDEMTCDEMTLCDGIPDGKTIVPFVEFQLPNGYPVNKDIIVDDPDGSIEKGVSDILERDVNFEAEQLQTGEISLCISNIDGDLFIEISPNGPELATFLKKLIGRGAEAARNDEWPDLSEPIMEYDEDDEW